MLRRTRGLRSGLGSILIALVLTGAWAVERWGPGLVPATWGLQLGSQSCRLDYVLDGDSLRLVCAGKPVEVRLHCIDAPEKGQQPWGDRSRAHLKEMATRRLDLIPFEQDRFGRTLGEVYSTGENRISLNLEQVRSGQAAVYDRYCDNPRYFRAEREAREEKRGIWKRRGLHQTPWKYRHRRS
ncbi:thermonuclease family protein [Thiorhodococcus mannitoliphagus]|uniref:Thermonuclease family protein n=1 Tax=Thiorhodococcus mannitoliphagus TaxID=329406 RepID=A0A6P1DUE1_9GAMM|nr:thermonuclease family protein [Thiorhodococcus mannitoliphagus]NEX19662.1 thermonuclease family protein [Thiorhodococcus mannitoliphagus]